MFTRVSQSQRMGLIFHRQDSRPSRFDRELKLNLGSGLLRFWRSSRWVAAVWKATSLFFPSRGWSFIFASYITTFGSGHTIDCAALNFAKSSAISVRLSLLCLAVQSNYTVFSSARLFSVLRNSKVSLDVSINLCNAVTAVLLPLNMCTFLRLPSFIMILYLLRGIITPLLPLSMYTTSFSSSTFSHPSVNHMFPFLGHWAMIVSQSSLLKDWLDTLTKGPRSPIQKYFFSNLSFCVLFIRKCTWGPALLYCSGSMPKKVSRSVLAADLTTQLLLLAPAPPSCPTPTRPFLCDLFTWNQGHKCQPWLKDASYIHSSVGSFRLSSTRHSVPISDIGMDTTLLPFQS